jgi:hypothetical protein
MCLCNVKKYIFLYAYMFKSFSVWFFSMYFFFTQTGILHGHGLIMHLKIPFNYWTISWKPIVELPIRRHIHAIYTSWMHSSIIKRECPDKNKLCSIEFPMLLPCFDLDILKWFSIWPWWNIASRHLQVSYSNHGFLSLLSLVIEGF